MNRIIAANKIAENFSGASVWAPENGTIRVYINEMEYQNEYMTVVKDDDGDVTFNLGNMKTKHRSKIKELIDDNFDDVYYKI